MLNDNIFLHAFLLSLSRVVCNNNVDLILNNGDDNGKRKKFIISEMKNDNLILKCNAMQVSNKKEKEEDQ